ncbi:hypothetical protein [Paenibacillus chitinolyticus]|uniref:hypothetical protein n=1 Tax=Paenibacillus chitinolyticus TaxID=79263 RepID=UPI0036638439
MRDDLTAIGITLTYRSGKEDITQGWRAKLCWADGAFLEDHTIEGEIINRYFVQEIGKAIDYVLEVATQFNLPIWKEFALWYSEDGADNDYPPPDGWTELLAAEAHKRGWRSYLSDPEVTL